MDAGDREAILDPCAASFAEAVGIATGLAPTGPLRALFRRVTPPASGWGIEIAAGDRDKRPDFGCSIKHRSQHEWPDHLRAATSYLSLRALVDTSAWTERIFFEFDAQESGDRWGGPHAFARLQPEWREPVVLAARLAAVRAPGPHDIGRLAARVGSAILRLACLGGVVSDLGVVIRSGVRQVRIGFALPASQLPAFLKRVSAEGGTVGAWTELVASAGALPRHVTAQLAVSDGVPDAPPRLSGVELWLPEGHTRACGEALAPLVSCGLVPDWLAQVALAWPARVALPRRGPQWPPIFRRAVSHVKFVGSREGELNAKLYLGASTVFGTFA